MPAKLTRLGHKQGATLEVSKYNIDAAVPIMTPPTITTTQAPILLN